MAQLPPKIPISSSNMSNWPIINPLFPHPHHQLLMPAANGWDVADEFADFAAARRGSHRRSASDSVAFLEPLMMINQVHHGQDDHDDDELMMIQSCMLISSSPDDMSSAAAAPPTLSSPSTDPSSPSDGAANNINNINNIIMGMMINDHNNISNINGNNIIDDLFKAEPGEVESPPPSPSSPAAADSVFDPKRVKRILANRQSAQRSRVRKLQYISELERSVTTLQSEVSALSPRVAFLDHQRLILNVDNSALKQRIAALAQDKIFKDAHQEALKKEIERLRQVYHQQNLKKMANQNSQDRNSDDALGCTDNDHIPN